MLDEPLLDDPDALAAADTRGLLRGVASAGARVRTAARLADEAGIRDLRPDGRPRAVLVAGPGAGPVADVLSALVAGGCLVLPLHPTGAPETPRWTLPGWVGPLDLLVIVTPAGTEAGLTSLVEQVYRRGCAVAAVTPQKSPLAEALEQARGMTMRFAPAPEAPDDPGRLWALLIPLLALGNRLGVLHAPPEAVEAVADRLDEVAARCGPAVATYENPAKTLAAELSDALPLLWSEGAGAAAVARRFASVLAALAGRPALAAELPDALTAHRALLAGAFAGAAAADPDDFFRDRVEEPEALRFRVVLLFHESTARAAAAPAARALALGEDTPFSELFPAGPGGGAAGPLEAVAELLAVTDFTAVYLTVASGGRSWD